MSDSSAKEHLGYVFVRAVVYAAGYSVYRPEVDDDSIDLGIAARGLMGTCRSPPLEVQVKCTGAGKLTKGAMSYRLELKNYDDLRAEDYLIPRILVVATMPEPIETGVKLTHAQLSVQFCAYWCSLRGMPEYKGKAKEPKVTVHLPRAQKFDSEAVQEMMEQVGRGEEL
jgi:hypothetical protein